MAEWKWTTADALTEQQWANQFWRAAKPQSFFYANGFVGGSYQSDIVVEIPDLEKEQGSQVTFGQIRDLTGSGVLGDSELEGNEESPATFDDAITLEQKRNAIRTKGKLSEQYPSDKRVRMWAEDLLSQWMASTIDQDLFTAAGGSPTKIYYGGDATATTDIEAGDYMTLQLLSKCKTYAAKVTPKITPKAMKGKGYFVCVMAPDQSFDLKNRDAAWAQAQREAQQRGPDNPLFTGSEGVWDGVVIHSHERVSLATNWGSGANLPGATALFMGTAAMGIAYAKRKIWNEKTFDYGNKVGFAIGAIYGVTKAVFNSLDNAVIAVRTYRTNN